MSPALYNQFLRLALRHSRRAAEAEDLLQDALLDAVAAGRADLSELSNRKWLAGVVRNRGLMSARGAGRRLRRETRWQHERPDAAAPQDATDFGAALRPLPPALKIVAALALSGHSRREIAYLLALSDTALRQRVAALKRQLTAMGAAMPHDTPGLNLGLNYGRIRDALLPQLLRQRALFASHDPDGHLFVVRRAPDGSHSAPPRQQDDGTTRKRSLP